MWILTGKRLAAFYRTHPRAKGPLVAWMNEMIDAHYAGPAEVKARHRSASFVQDKVIFNIGGNKYRLIVRFVYANLKAKPPENGIVKVLFVGTHVEYDAIDVAEL